MEFEVKVIVIKLLIGNNRNEGNSRNVMAPFFMQAF